MEAEVAENKKGVNMLKGFNNSSRLLFNLLSKLAFPYIDVIEIRKREIEI